MPAITALESCSFCCRFSEQQEGRDHIPLQITGLKDWNDGLGECLNLNKSLLVCVQACQLQGQLRCCCSQASRDESVPCLEKAFLGKGLVSHGLGDLSLKLASAEQRRAINLLSVECLYFVEFGESLCVSTEVMEQDSVVVSYRQECSPFASPVDEN